MGFNPTLISTAINAVTRRVGGHMAGATGSAIMNRMTPQRNRHGQTAAQYGEYLDERMAGAGGRYSAGQTDQNMPTVGGQQQSPYGGGYSPGAMGLNQVNSESQIVQKLDTSIQVLERIGISVDQIKFYLSEFMAENKRHGNGTAGIAGANQGLAGQQQPGFLSGILSGLAGLLGMGALGNALKPKTPKTPKPTASERTAARNAARGTRTAGQNAARAASAEVRGARVLSDEARSAAARSARSTTAGLSVRTAGGALLRRGVPILGAAFAANDEFQESGNATRAGAVGLGAWGGAAAGMAMGATLGSVVPGFGTVIGGALGGIAGGIAGSGIGRGIYDSFATPGGLGNTIVGNITSMFSRRDQERSASIGGINGKTDLKIEAKSIVFSGPVTFTGTVTGLGGVARDAAPSQPQATDTTPVTPAAGTERENRTRSSVPEIERPRGETGSASQRRDEDRRDGMIDGVLLDQISRGEGTEVSHYNRLASSRSGRAITSAYDAEVYHGKYSGAHKPISQMTIREIFALMRQMVNQQKRAGIPEDKRSSALGKYQINRRTLLDMLKPPPLGMALSEDTIFSEYIQDRIAMHLLNYGDSRGNNGLDELRAGTATAEEFQNGTLARRWASFPKTSGRSAYGQRVGAENVADIIEAARTRPEGSTAGPGSPDPIGTPAGISGVEGLYSPNPMTIHGALRRNQPGQQYGASRPRGGRRVAGAHRGADYGINDKSPDGGSAGVRGTPIKAPIAGKIIKAGGGSYNALVIHAGSMKKSNGNRCELYIRFIHNDTVTVKRDDYVLQGQNVATAGNRGGDYAVHVHMEVYLTNNASNALNGTGVDTLDPITFKLDSSFIPVGRDGKPGVLADSLRPPSASRPAQHRPASEADGAGGTPEEKAARRARMTPSEREFYDRTILGGASTTPTERLAARTPAERQQRWDDYVSGRRSFSSFRPTVVRTADDDPWAWLNTPATGTLTDAQYVERVLRASPRPTRPAAAISQVSNVGATGAVIKAVNALARSRTPTPTGAAAGVGASSTQRSRPRAAPRGPSMMWWLSVFSPGAALGLAAGRRVEVATRPY